MTRAPAGAAVMLAPDALAHYGKALRCKGEPAAAWLAQAAAASAGWPAGFQALIVVRKDPPALAVLGFMDSARQQWIECQLRSLQDACGRLRYVDSKMLDSDCRRLADRLRELLGLEGVSKARWLAIPRGGTIVLSRLMRLMGIEPGQSSAVSPDRPAIVVDDCALSGARFCSFLQRTDPGRVIFAPLYSHPDLRAAILARESRVAHCVSARDLEARGSSQPVAEDAKQGGFYWSGDVQPLCFPWNEPDRSFWNPHSHRWELAWRIVPPRRCEKNRPQPGSTPIPIYIQPDAKGPLRPAAHVLFAACDGGILVCDVKDRQIFSLKGSASALWDAVVRYGGVDAAVSEVEAQYEAVAGVVRSDGLDFLQGLIRRGLLDYNPPPPRVC